MTDDPKRFPQQRLTRKAKEHIKKLLPHYRNYGMSATALASAIILSVPIPPKGNVPAPIIPNTFEQEGKPS